ncbi:LPS export ABC transporter periplasmic protein LptC [Sphingomonas sp. ASV193]|uniref:LPS export ABC transporter periplasmic protein LptC n=1 Tax=Sphingomonas sp. ASV193 TaxID=3144405 RepID=UPI0032E8C06B
MAGPADRQAAPRDWATPGSRHDRLVGLAKWGLPGAAIALGALLLIAPLGHKQEVSFILDKKKVDSTKERMWLEDAKYRGADNEGRAFAINATRAIQPSSSQPVVVIHGMSANLDLPRGPVTIAADRGRYNLDKQLVNVDGPVGVSGPDGYKLATRDVVVDLKTRRIDSTGPVQGVTSLGPFSANQMTADLNSHSVVLSGGARLKIVQGAVR